MERNASVTQVPPLTQPSTTSLSFARTCGTFSLRCLKAIARGYVESAFYYP